MFKLVVTYPERREEREVLDRMTEGDEPVAAPVLQTGQVLAARQQVHQIYVDGRIKEYVLDIIGATRRPDIIGLSSLGPLIEYGASPRAAIFLIRSAKARAFLQGRNHVIPDDVKDLGLDILRHRILLTYRADAEGIDADALLRQILENVAVP
jgi:MoxR-like ATPase